MDSIGNRLHSAPIVRLSRHLWQGNNQRGWFTCDYFTNNNFSPNSFNCAKKTAASGGLIQRISSQSVCVAEHSRRARSAGKIPAALLCAPVIASVRDKPAWQQSPQISAKSLGSWRSSRAVTLLARMFAALSRRPRIGCYTTYPT